jgi:hypothetical protein
MSSTVRYLRAAIPVALLLSGTLALSHPATASASAADRSAAASPAAASGSNLLVNPRATAGDVSAQGWDAVTIPGWQVAAGLSATNRVLASRTIGPVGRSRRAEFAPRAGGGVLPAGTTSAQVTVELQTSLTNANGPNAPLVGYNRAVAADLSLTVSAPVRPPAPVTPPPANVPGYQHVFLFYFENEDYHQIVGNTKQAPYLNSLLKQGSVLSQFYAEEHPSDGNYLAVAGGSTFGIPLDDPEEENPVTTGTTTSR